MEYIYIRTYVYTLEWDVNGILWEYISTKTKFHTDPYRVYFSFFFPLVEYYIPLLRHVASREKNETKVCSSSAWNADDAHWHGVADRADGPVLGIPRGPRDFLGGLLIERPDEVHSWPAQFCTWNLWWTWSDLDTTWPPFRLFVHPNPAVRTWCWIPPGLTFGTPPVIQQNTLDASGFIACYAEA